MSPFLAQVQVINVAGKSADSDETESDSTGKPATADSVRASAAKFKAKALDQAQKNLDQATADLDADTADLKSHTEVRHREKSSHSEDGMFAAIPLAAIVFTFLYLIVRALMAPFNNRQKRRAQQPAAEGLSDEEAVIVEKLQRTLAQMESRVESLETILIDQARNKEKYGTKF